MESPSILRRNSGFTLVEVLISLGILVIIASLGLFVSFDFYRHSSFHSERSVIVSILQKARNESVDNIDQVAHGVHFQSNPTKYILFECPSSMPQCKTYVPQASDLEIDASYNVTIAATPFDVVFDQLSGDSTEQSIDVADSSRHYQININAKGRIDW